MIRGEGRSGRSNIGNAGPRLREVGRQGSDDREHQRLSPSRQGLNNDPDRRLVATGVGQFCDGIPEDAFSPEADEAAARVAALLATPATILSVPGGRGDV